jgi:hypothetical protein
MLRRTPLDAPDPLEVTWSAHAEALRVLVGSADEESATAILVSRASQSSEGHVAVVEGLVFSILVDYEAAPLFFHRLQESVRDDLATACAAVARVAHEKIDTLSDAAMRQLLWLARQLISVHVRHNALYACMFLALLSFADLA